MFRLRFTLSRFEFWFLFMFILFPLLKGRQTPLSSSKNVVKVTKNLDRVHVSKKKFNFQISQRNQELSYWSSFLKLGFSNQKESLVNFSKIQSNLDWSIFVRQSKIEIFLKRKSVFSVSLRLLAFSCLLCFCPCNIIVVGNFSSLCCQTFDIYYLYLLPHLLLVSNAISTSHARRKFWRFLGKISIF